MFGAAITPSFHALATNFVTLDNFTDPGDGSMDGWSWALQGRVTNTETITQQINYVSVNRGLSYESEGTNRNVPVDWGTVAERNAVGGPPRKLVLSYHGRRTGRHRQPAARHRRPCGLRCSVRRSGRLHLDGPDHVDSHRTTAYVAGPYVKKGAVVSAHYSQGQRAPHH
jgi:hypothetical protein